MRERRVGAGTGAAVGALKGGIGRASTVLGSGITVSANAARSALEPETGVLYGELLQGRADHPYPRVHRPPPALRHARQRPGRRGHARLRPVPARPDRRLQPRGGRRGADRQPTRHARPQRPPDPRRGRRRAVVHSVMKSAIIAMSSCSRLWQCSRNRPG
ncbi:P1 family peptidase [Streptomyces olivaceoviridis]